MRVRADSYFLVAAALLSATQVASAQLTNSYPWCASDRGRTDVPSCYYNDGKLCWVTMSGIGVCVPYFPPKAASSRHRHIPPQGGWESRRLGDSLSSRL